MAEINERPETDLTSLTSRYEQIIRENGIFDFDRIDVVVPELHGQHFASSCDYLTVHLKDGQQEPVHLFTKRMVHNFEYTQLIKDLKLFEKEAGFFNEIVPLLNSFIERRAPPGTAYALDMLPKCYYASADLVIMENLAQRGYALLDKVQRQDLNAARMYMKTLAKFNAPSYLLLKDEMSVEKFIEKYPFMAETIGVEGQGQGRNMGVWLIPLLQAAEKILEAGAQHFEEGPYALESLRRIQENFSETMFGPLTAEDGHVCYVVAHGDTWNNNHLFRKDPETQELVHHIMCDFQIVRAASPTIDLAYYMFSSVKHQVRRDEWHNLLKLYYDSLEENVQLLNGQLDFSFEDMVLDYKKKCAHGFTLGVAMCGFVHSADTVGNLDEIEGDVMNQVAGSVGKWMDKNPAKLKECAGEIVDMFQEYKQLARL